MPAKKSSFESKKPKTSQIEAGNSQSDRSDERAPPEKALTAHQIRKEILALDRILLATIQQRSQLVSDWIDANPNDENLSSLLNPAWVKKVTTGGKPKLQVSSDDAHHLLANINEYCQTQATPHQVTYLGPVYSYSFLAAVQCFGEYQQLVPVNSIAAVFDQVVSEKTEFGVVPIENSTDGRIADTLTMIAQHSIAIYREIHLPIHHCLIGAGKLKDIREIRSKAQALSQCRNWLDRTFSHKVKRVATDSSSDAAQDAQQLGKQVAAIASREAALGFDLQVIAPNIEDQVGNMTRFAVIVKPGHPRIQLPGKTGRDKTSIMFEIPHQPGSLADVINVFKRAKLNLTWIESFPKPGAYSEYTFFAEFQGHRREVKVRNALASLEKKTEELTVLGSYPDSSSVVP